MTSTSHARPVCLHSVHADFAETQRMTPAAYLRRRHPWRSAPLKVGTCGCGDAHLVRIGRSLWMRLIPCSRRYYCRRCGAAVLRLRLPHRHPYGSVYLPAPPLKCDRDSLGRILPGALTRLTELAAAQDRRRR